MWNRDEDLMKKLRERSNGKFPSGMLTYKEVEHPELDEEKVLEAIHTISEASKIPEDRIRKAIINLIDEQDRHERFMDKLAEMTRSMNAFENAAEMAAEAVSEYTDRERFGRPADNCCVISSSFFKKLKERFSPKEKPESQTEIDSDIETEQTNPFAGHTSVYVQLPDGTTLKLNEASQTTPVTSPYAESEDPTRTSSREPMEFSAVVEGISGDIYKLFRKLARRRKSGFRKTGIEPNAPFYRRITKDARRVIQTIGREHTRFNKNVRPKGTHSHFRFYR